MDIEFFRQYCLSKKGVTEEFPFDEFALTFKVCNKIFAITSLNNPEFRVNLKCDPIRSEELRSEYPDIQPGWHMNKKHWNTVYFERELDDKLLKSLIDHSYELIVSGLTKKQKEELSNL